MYFVKCGLRCQYQKRRVDATNATYLGKVIFFNDSAFPDALQGLFIFLAFLACCIRHKACFPPRYAAPAALRTGTTSSSLAYPFFVSASWGLQGRGVTKLELGNERK
jgi:hypothetical protein